jgi:phage gp36-like protein
MAQPLAISLLPATAIIAPGSGAEMDMGAVRGALLLDLRVTTFTPISDDPVPLVAVTLETRADAAAPWRAADVLEAGAAGTFELAAGGLERFVRVSWTLTNMTTATIDVTGVAHVTYCDPSDITDIAVPEHSIEEIPASKRAKACITATDVADGFVGAAYTLPLTAWGEDLRQQCAYLAAAQLFSGRGFDSQGPDKNVADNRDSALKWLDRLANGRLSPPGMIDSTPEEFDGGSFVVSARPPRGW